MRRRGIRVTVTALATGAVTIALLAASVWLVLAQRHSLTAGLDTTLEGRAADIAAFVSSHETLPETLAQSDVESFVQVVSADGTVLVATPNVAGEGVLVPLDVDAARSVTVENLPVDDDRFRIYIRPLPGLGSIVVGTTFDVVDEATSSLVGSLLVALPLLIGLLALLTWWVVGQTLRPVEAIRRQVSAIGTTDLDGRVAVPGTNDEISRLAETMNEMLDRLDDSAARQRRFVDDASHDLRSPLARMHTVLDVDLDGVAPVGPIGSLREDVAEMQRLVDDLLFLARADRGPSPLRMQPVDLDDLVLIEAERAVSSRDVTVDLSGVSGAQVLGESPRLRRAIRNLLDNAIRHADAKVMVSVGEEGEVARVTVGDDGPGVPAAEADRIFDRFACLDESRTSGGTGLGLAIAREIAVSLNGTLWLDNPGEQGARFVLELPAAR